MDKAELKDILNDFARELKTFYLSPMSDILTSAHKEYHRIRDKYLALITDEICPECKGAKKVVIDEGVGLFATGDCPTCKGTGRVNRAEVLKEIEDSIKEADTKQSEASSDLDNPSRFSNIQYWLGHEHALRFIKMALKEGGE